MIPAHCRLKHEPEKGVYGDCLRAAVASMFEMDTKDVPHFFHDGCDGETGHGRLHEWCVTQGYLPVLIHYPGSATLEQVGEVIRASYPDLYYLLFASIAGGDHVVIGRNGETAHNPSWYPTPIIGPNSNGHWGVMHFVSVRFAE